MDVVPLLSHCLYALCRTDVSFTIVMLTMDLSHICYCYYDPAIPLYESLNYAFTVLEFCVFEIQNSYNKFYKPIIINTAILLLLKQYYLYFICVGYVLGLIS